MSWRPWITSSLMIGTVIFNVALLWLEHVEPPRGSSDAKNEVSDKLLDLTFIASDRFQNFVDMGLPEDLAKASSEKARRLSSKTRLNGFQQMLQDARDEVMPFACSNTGLHPRYAMSAFLLVAENDELKVIEPTAVAFEVGEWYSESRIVDVYNTLELNPKRQADATLMGMAAVILKQEEKVIYSDPPFNHNSLMGSGWGWDRVDKAYPSAKKKIINYFSMMHVIGELASARDGVCE